MRIAVFCSANENIDPEFFKMTEELGAWMAENHHALIFGGSNQGLMQCAARAVKEHGGHTIGVVPTLLEKDGKVSEYLDENIPSRTLSDRKDIMVKECDVAIALPGGVGTLDEIFCMAASKSIASDNVVLPDLVAPSSTTFLMSFFEYSFILLLVFVCVELQI